MISRYFDRPNVVLNHEQGSKKKEKAIAMKDVEEIFSKNVEQ